MSLMYQCDICGADMHKLGKNNGKRLHVDVGELEDYNNETSDSPIAWNITDFPIYRIDLCHNCYNTLILNLLDMREEHGLARDLQGVAIDVSSIQV